MLALYRFDICSLGSPLLNFPHVPIGQLHALEENEIKQIREAFRAVGGTEYEERVKWCFIVVTKRINIRMFSRA